MTNLERIRERLLGDLDRAEDFLFDHSVCSDAFCTFGEEHGLCTGTGGAGAHSLSDCRRCIRAWLESEADA